MGIDKGAGIDGKNAATIKSKRKIILEFGTLIQNTSPEKYLNKRIKLSVYLKTKDVKGWTGYWLRVDQRGSNNSISFDNMSKRNIEGTRDFENYEIVLDVPCDASNLAYGCILAGTGQVWFDKIAFEIVEASVPLTGSENKKTQHKNLNFEE